MIYLDNNSTTRTEPRVVEAMLPYFSSFYGNASSNHSFGKDVHHHIEKARYNIASFIHAESRDIVFTSGGTESVNLGIIGYALGTINNRKRIITCSTEHKAVLETCVYLEKIGFEIVYLPVNRRGIVNLTELEIALNDATLMVSIMLVNNETGVIQPIKQISAMSHSKSALFMCDATQAFGKIPIDVTEFGIDLMAFSGHKFYGPKGIGGLYINGLSVNKSISGIGFGGGQEKGIRSGTLNVPGIIGLSEASSIAASEMHENEQRIKSLRDRLESGLLQIPGSFINGDLESRLFNTTNICFPGQDANVIIGRLQTIAVSTGSACTSSIMEPSHVLTAMGLNDDEANASIRFSLGKFNTEDEIDETITFFHNLLNS